MEREELTPDPQQLRAEAQKEASRRGLEDYSEAIRLLKEDKGFSFREIAEWFTQRGLNVDHNAVWRAYSKTISTSAQGRIDERYERFERKPASDQAMPWLEET